MQVHGKTYGYDQHPHGTAAPRKGRRSMARPWRLSDGREHPVTVRRISPNVPTRA